MPQNWDIRELQFGYYGEEHTNTRTDFKVILAATMKSPIFWVLTPYSTGEVHQCFTLTYRLHLQGRRVNQARKAISRCLFIAGFFLGLHFDPSCMRTYASEYCTLYACTFLEYKRKRDKTKRAVRTSCLRTTSNILALKQVRFHNEQDNRTAEVRYSSKNCSAFSRRHAHMLQILNLYGCSRRNRQALERVCCQLDKLELSYSSGVMEGWRDLCSDRQRGAKKPTIQLGR